MADLVGSLVSYGLNRFSQERSFQQQKELQSDAQNYNTMMWNKANAFNSPLSQMQRFKAAGLNPNLIYGQMTGGLAAPTISAGSAPSPAQAPGASLLESAQVGLIDAQKKNIEADTKAKESQLGLNDSIIRLNDAEVESIGHQIGLTDQQIEESKSRVAEIQKNIESMDANIDQVRANIDLLRSQKGLTDQQALSQWIDNIWANERNQAYINQLKSATNLNNAQAKELLTLLAAKQYNIQCNSAYLAAMTKRLNQTLPHDLRALINSNKAFDLGLPTLQAESNLANHRGWYYGLKYGTQVVGACMQLLTPASILASGRMNAKSAAAARENRAIDYIAGDGYNNINRTW